VKMAKRVFEGCDKQLTVNVLGLCEKPEAWEDDWRSRDTCKCKNHKVIWDFGGKNIVEN